MNAARMLEECFRRQHPELYDRPAVDYPELPGNLLTLDGGWESGEIIPEEPMGDPELRPTVAQEPPPNVGT